MFFTDWEGPWILTDFAYELANAVFNNDRFFRNLSLYDDYLAYEVKREGYEAGYTMKLLIPFFAAAKLKNEEVCRIAENVAAFVPDSKLAIDFLQQNWKPVVISTSYTQYLKVTSRLLGVEGFLHGTEIDFDSLEIDDELSKNLLNQIDIIASLKDRELFEFLDNLFGEKEIKEIVDEIRAVGAREKAEILEKYCMDYGIECPVAIGDSISDYKMFERARELGGYAIAFNGNKYAIEHADVAIISNSAVAEAVVVYLVMKKGVKAVRNINHTEIPAAIREEFRRSNTEIYIVDESIAEEITEISMRMRVKLRGEAGLLG